MAIRVVYSPVADLVTTSYTFIGLSRLASSGLIALSTGAEGDFGVRTGHWAVNRATVRRPDAPAVERPRRVAIDYHDSSQFFCFGSLEGADLYFKANLRWADAERMLNPQQLTKLRPFGPFFVARPSADRQVLRRAVGGGVARYRWARHRGRDRVSAAREALSQARRLKRYRERGPVDRHEAPPVPAATRKGGPLVYFVARCWQGQDELNEFRYALVRRLREALGAAFDGGLVESPLTLSRFPDATVPYVRQRENMSRWLAAPIAVNTLGTSDCFSWRFASAFAAGRVVVSERHNLSVPERLDRDDGLVLVSGIEEIVAAVAEISRDTAEMYSMQRRSWACYRTKLAPEVRLAAVVDEACRHDLVAGNHRGYEV